MNILYLLCCILQPKFLQETPKETENNQNKSTVKKPSMQLHKMFIPFIHG